ncbi:UPF0161 protein At3g09310 [Salvia splendens]|uniref:UPF0161 protein At3g09310 n=1 Tax=Salvia splendens TaxID=180675 RepID=UPI001C25FBC8|nr:UPF0161 protein At3g09310 [Salvia splendens]
MALLCSSNHIICQNPQSSKTPNFKFNEFSSSFTDGLKGRRCVRAFSVSGENSSRSGVEEEEVKDIGVKAALSMLKFYKREISPLMPNSCRYVPTCSEYSMIAYKKYGVGKGTILTAWRLCRCNPLGGSGFDPPRWFGETTPPQE